MIASVPEQRQYEFGGYMLIIKRKKADLDWNFSFFLASGRSKAKEPGLPNSLSAVVCGEKLIYTCLLHR